MAADDTAEMDVPDLNQNVLVDVAHNTDNAYLYTCKINTSFLILHNI
ncbi:hypothetical protein EMIT0210MI2_10822 [Priestia megaterium]